MLTIDSVAPMRSSAAGGDERTDQVDVEDLAKQFGVVSSAGSVARNAGRIDQAADQAKPIDHLVEGRANLLLVGDVGLEEDRVSSAKVSSALASASSLASMTATGQPSSSSRSPPPGRSRTRHR